MARFARLGPLYGSPARDNEYIILVRCRIAVQTTLIDVVMKRIVRGGVMRLQRLDRRDNTSFANDPPGVPISEKS